MQRRAAMKRALRDDLEFFLRARALYGHATVAFARAGWLGADGFFMLLPAALLRPAALAREPAPLLLLLLLLLPPCPQTCAISPPG